MATQQTTLVEAPGGLWSKVVKLLRYLAGDPATSDRAVFLSDPVAVTDTAVSLIEEAQDLSQDFALAQIQFTETSGTGRFDLTGGNPNAAGTRGMQIPAGGGTMNIRGAWNIRNFRVIGETGNALSFTVMLFKTSLWASSDLRNRV